ncbi:hypothetical protein M446_0800 [Methylobacterium sp. 4-46]|nr:hypothetical protein M446_0800 [Methylobacterium sp. 4-46]
MSPDARDLSPADRFGPWDLAISSVERIARLRALRAIAHLHAGPRAEALCSRLRDAEHDPAALPGAMAALDHLTAVGRRRILASFAAIHRRSPAAHSSNSLSPNSP